MSLTRIAFVDHAPFVGGAETVLLDLIAHLDRTRFEPVVYVPRNTPLVPLLDAQSIPWRDLYMPHINTISPLMPLRWLLASYRLARRVHQENIDLIHTNTVRAHLIGALTQTRPVVWMLHDDTFPLWLFRRLRNRATHLIANSHTTAQYYQLSADPHTSIIHNGVDTHTTRGNRHRFRRRIGINPDKLLIAHVGRLVRWKGQHLFIRAAAHITKSFPNAHFVLVGTHSETDDTRSVFGGGAKFRAELQHLVDSFDLNERLTFAGHQDNIDDVYAGIDLLVHSSTRAEPFGRVLIEAMAAGVPVIASDQGGPTEIVQDGVTGLLVSPGSSDLLAKAMRALLADSDLHRSMGIAAQQRAQEHFDIKQQVDRMQAVYQDVLNRTGKTH